MNRQALFNYFHENHNLILIDNEIDEIIYEVMNVSAKQKTLSEAKFELNSGLQNGITCPCCGRFAKRYRRNLTASMTYALILMCKSGNRDFFHVNDYFEANNIPSKSVTEFSKLRFFGLIESKIELREDWSDRNGHYRITPKGIDFVMNRITVMQYVTIYNNKVKTVSNEQVTIADSLKQKFNYAELMNTQIRFNFLS